VAKAFGEDIWMEGAKTWNENT